MNFLSVNLFFAFSICSVTITSSNILKNTQLFINLIAYECLFQNYQRDEKEAAQYAKKQRAYKLLDDDDDGDTGMITPATVSSEGKSESHQKHFRKKRKIDEDEDNEVLTFLFSFFDFCLCCKLQHSCLFQWLLTLPST